MVFASNHYLLAFGGELRGAEAFSMSLRLSGFTANSGDQAVEQALCDDFAAALTAWWPTGISGTGARLAWVKLNEIGTNGRYLQEYTNVTDLVPSINPSGASTHPNQIACVVTLETGAVRGLAHRGRMFFPIPSAPISVSDGLMSEATADGLAAKAVSLLDALNVVAPGGRVKVCSSVGAGATRNVTGVSVGRVLDTMRSRRTQLEEGRRTAALAAVP